MCSKAFKILWVSYNKMIKELTKKEVYLLSIGLLIFYLFWSYLKWFILSSLFMFFYPIIWLVVMAVFILYFVKSFRSSKRFFNKKQVRTYVPLIINVLTIIIIIFVPMTNIWLTVDFYVFKHTREQVMQKIMSGELQPNVSHNSSMINLPLKYKFLSKGGGDIVFSNTEEYQDVFFFTFRGILDNFSGYVYTTDMGRTLENGWYSDVFQQKKYNDNWYWIASQ